MRWLFEVFIVLMVWTEIHAQSFEFNLPADFHDTSTSSIEHMLHDAGILPVDYRLHRFSSCASAEGDHIHFQIAFHHKFILDSRVILHFYPKTQMGWINGNISLVNSNALYDSNVEPYWVYVNNTWIPTSIDTVGSLAVYRHDNQVLFSRDLASYYKDTTVIFPLFHPDAVSASGAEYGILVVDSNDQELLVFNTLYEPSLVPLEISGDTIYLRNKYVYISDISGRKKSLPYILKGRMLTGRSDSLFECLQVLYHIYGFRIYLDTLGFTAIHPGSISVDAHGSAADQSSYIPDYLTFGDGGVDDAEDAEVIIHEFGHALIESATPGTNIGFERKAADEGSCDYWATGYTKSLSSFKPEYVFPWDGHNEFWKGRIINSSATYPTGVVSNSIHQTGQMWSSTLIQISNLIGRRAMDKLLLESYYNFTSNLSFTQMAQLVIKTDSLLNGGQYHYILCHLFTQRGFLNGDCYNGIQQQLPQRTFLYTSAKQLYLNSLPEDSYTYTIYDTQGKLVMSGCFNGTTHETKAQVVQGLYFFSLQGSKGTVYHEKWLITE